MRDANRSKEPTEERCTKRRIGDRFVPLKVRRTQFEMHEELMVYTKTRNIRPKNDIEILPRLLLETIVPEASMHSVSGKKNMLQMGTVNLDSPRVETTDCCRTTSRKLYSYNTQPIITLFCNESLVNSNARMIDYSKKNLMILAQNCMLLAYDPIKNKTEEWYNGPNKLYSIRVNDFSENFVGIAYKSGEFQVIDVKLMIPLRTYGGLAPEDKILSIDWMSDAVVHGTSKGNVLLRDVRAKEDEKMELVKHLAKICCVKANRLNENYVISSDVDGVVCVSDKRRGILNRYEEHSNCVRSLAWSPTHEMSFMSGGKFDGLVKQWSSNLPKSTSTLDTRSCVYDVGYTADGNWLAASGKPECDLKMYSATDNHPITSFKDHATPIYHLVLSFDRSTALTCSQDGKVAFWDLTNHYEQKPETTTSIEISMVR